MRWSSFVLASLLAAAPLAGQAASWDQERATTLARELIPPLETLRAQMEREPVPKGREKARAKVVEAVAVLHATTRNLVAELEKGAGRAETQSLVRTIETAELKATHLTREDPADFEQSGHIERFKATLGELLELYGGPGA